MELHHPIYDGLTEMVGHPHHQGHPARSETVTSQGRPAWTEMVRGVRGAWRALPAVKLILAHHFLEQWIASNRTMVTKIIYHLT